ncbi:VOC family protein [Robertkochia aurantiaca]|uniref:VOC family protein n=1 Tax=Robertkochia aurantiaca TaxID=2873700 RepID=UPI001CC9A68B|nr:VOC family protein [Robertkochia sp. 3YJGBD-33]
MEKRVTGIGGIFIKSSDPEGLKNWYRRHLGIPTDQYGWNFVWKDDRSGGGSTQWGVFDASSTYFAPSQQYFMMNFRVEDLEKLLSVLKEEGVEVVGEMETFSYGKFGWVMDPDGNKIELWEPIDEALQ